LLQSSLPKRYRDDRLFCVALDPNRLWVYWDEGEAVRRIASRRLPKGWEEASRQLRLCGSQGDERIVEGHGPFGSLYVEGLCTGARYRVEYGVRLASGFLPFLEREVCLPGGQHCEPHLLREQAKSFSAYSFYSMEGEV
jgi:hypothetical protein